jgi:hypothetical protein
MTTELLAAIACKLAGEANPIGGSPQVDRVIGFSTLKVRRDCA